MVLIKQGLDEWLDNVSYSGLNSGEYVPTEFALTFMNFIKLVNGSAGESHKTPPVHLKMLDKLVEPSQYVANLCFRGAAKTTLFGEYFFPFLATFGVLEGFGRVSSAIYVSDSMDNGVKSLRKNMEFRYDSSEFLQEWLPVATFTDNYIEFKNREGYRFGLKMFGAKTGLRGTKIFGKRPPICVLDDLVSDDDSKSKAAMNAIKDTVYKGVNHALDPTRRKVIFNGTPFNTEDILIEAVESGAWDVNVWPVCERFPCTREEFQGAWPDRFSFEYIQAQYDMAEKTGKLSGFFQELMLRISSEEERLVQDAEIRWYERAKLLKNKGSFNFYITTDFATSEKQTADYSVISVWAYNSNGDWFWVDGWMDRATMDKSIDQLFRLVQLYKPQQVGVETSGQQGAFIKWISNEMMNRNIWFNFAMTTSAKGGSPTPGIRPVADKLTRFNMVVPWFKAGKFYFPEEMKQSQMLQMGLAQIRLTTYAGIKGKDDFLDTVSMLGYMTPWKPSDSVPVVKEDVAVWEELNSVTDEGNLSSYIV
jgi:predicted phage terminase large subunit-like protein